MTPVQKIAVDLGLVCKSPCDCVHCELVMDALEKARRAGLEEASVFVAKTNGARELYVVDRIAVALLKMSMEPRT